MTDTQMRVELRCEIRDSDGGIRAFVVLPTGERRLVASMSSSLYQIDPTLLEDFKAIVKRCMTVLASDLGLTVEAVSEHEVGQAKIEPVSLPVLTDEGPDNGTPIH